jgi:hypothetical protein
MDVCKLDESVTEDFLDMSLPRIIAAEKLKILKEECLCSCLPNLVYTRISGE